MSKEELIHKYKAYLQAEEIKHEMFLRNHYLKGLYTTEANIRCWIEVIADLEKK